MPYWALFKGTNGNRIVNVHLDSSSGCLLAPSISVGLGDCSSSFAEKWTVSTDAEVAGGSSGGTNLAPIIGGAVGGAVGLALLIGLGVYLNRRKSKSQASHELESMPKAANAPTGNPSPYHSSASAQLAPNPLMPENASAAPYYGSAQWTAPFVSENPKTNPPAYSGSRNPGLPIAPVSRQISNQQFYSHGGDEFDLAAQAFSSDSQASRFTGTTVSPTVGRSLGDSGIPWNNREPTLLNSENSTTSKSTLLPVSKILIAASDVTYDLNAGLLGRGSFGTVYRGVFRGNLPVAVKVLNVATDTEVFDAFRREVATWEGLNHDNVLGLQGFCISPPMMIMKLVNGGNMREFLDRKNWDQALGRQLLQDISEGMNYLHVMNVLHGDLKSENVMVDVKPNGNITGKITDFGMSRFRPDPNRNSTNHQPGGTLPFMAPELFDNKRLERPADVYAFAMTCYEVVTYGRYPRQGYSQFDIIRGKRPAIPPETPRRLQSLIERCWAHEPETRPTFAAVVNEMTAIVALD